MQVFSNLAELNNAEKATIVVRDFTSRVSVDRLRYFEEHPGSDYDGELYMAFAIMIYAESDRICGYLEAEDLSRLIQSASALEVYMSPSTPNVSSLN